MLYVQQLLEGKQTDTPGMHDTACPEAGTLRASSFSWGKAEGRPVATAAAAAAGRPVFGWAGTLYDVPAVPAREVRCVKIWGRLLAALEPYKQTESGNAGGWRAHLLPGKP
eukprot:SAG22_NODE_8745_length_633_cov_0.777154_1_plen_111_part_00